MRKILTLSLFICLFICLFIAFSVISKAQGPPPMAFPRSTKAADSDKLDNHDSTYFQIDMGITGITDTTNTTSSTVVASATAVKAAKDAADAKVPFTQGLESAKPLSCTGLSQYFATDTSETWYCNSSGTYSKAVGIPDETGKFMCFDKTTGYPVACVAADIFPADLIPDRLVASFSGGGSVLAEDTWTIVAPFSCTITGWYVTTDHASATVAIDVWKIAWSTSAKPAVGDTILTGGYLGTSSAYNATGTTTLFTTTTITKGDLITFHVNSGASNVTELQVEILVNK